MINSKGQSSKPIFLITMAFITLLLLGIASGTQTYTSDYVKKQTVDLRTERIANAAFALNSVPKGHIEIAMSDYSFKYESGEVFVKYQEEEGSIPLEDISVDDVDGPNSYTEVESVLCIEKNRYQMNMTVGGC